MPNQLSIPFKNSYLAQIRQATREYIQTHHTDTHPDAFKQDIAQWEKSRADATRGVMTTGRIDSILRYHAQLVFILTKLPPNIGLDIHYASAFFPSELPLGMKNLLFERASIVFNLAALYSQLAGTEDRSNSQGIRRAINHYQNSAGTLDYLRTTVLPKFYESLEAGQEAPPELTEDAVESLEFMMLAQAQECVWQHATLANTMKNSVVSKLAMQAAIYYSKSRARLLDSSAEIRSGFPSSWLAHLETKQLHFEAASQYRKSLEDLEARRWGEELARLKEAHALAKKGYDIARRGGVVPAVLDDIKGIMITMQNHQARAEKDNDLIYHHDVPPSSLLEPILPATLANKNIPPGLAEPKNALEKSGEPDIFESLVSWGAREAINVYKDQRLNWMEALNDRVLALNSAITDTLRALNLPAAVDALDKPIGLPPSLLQKAEEVRIKDGPQAIEHLIEDIHALASQNADLLEEAMGILDQEAEVDDAFHKATPGVRRPLSHDANEEWIEKYERYNHVLRSAGESDRLVETKWEEWEETIARLTLDEEDLVALVPTSTGSATSLNRETKKRARALRTLMEHLDEVKDDRARVLARAQRMVDADDVQPRIMREAAARERWTDVTPAMFQDAMDEEMGKFDKFDGMVDEGAEKQGELLAQLQGQYDAFLQSRKDDATVKDREHALQSLELGYHKYKEITRNLNEAMNFYNDFAGILMKFKDSCKDWSTERQVEMHKLAEAMRTVSLDRESAKQAVPRAQPVQSTESPRPQRPKEPTAPRAITPPLAAPPRTATPPAAARTVVPKKAPRMPSAPTAPPAFPPPPRMGVNLPPPGSDDWESVALPPGPTPKSAKKRVKNAA